MTPYLTIYTSTFRRPQKLLRCMKSIEKQTKRFMIEHVILPDYIGLGVGGMYTRVAEHKEFARGKYVFMLCDDDELEHETVVEDFIRVAQSNSEPPVVIVKTNKANHDLPTIWNQAPVCGRIDLNNFIVRSDVWKDHCQAFGNSYCGDFYFIDSVWKAGHKFVWWDYLFSHGDVSGGKPE